MSLKAVILIFLVCSVAVGVIISFAAYLGDRNFELNSQYKLEKERSGAKVKRKLYEEFCLIQPETLVDWKVIPPSIEHPWLTWQKNGISFCDRNADGIPDIKYRLYPKLDKTETYWEDTDYDGILETEVTVGPFHRHTKPLTKPVLAPSAK